MFVPINVHRFVEKAWTRGADAIILDLEDSIPLDQKENARAMVKDTIPIVGKGGADVIVRINHPMALAVKDVEASIWPGLVGIQYPKASAPEIRRLDEIIAEFEKKRGVRAGGIEILPLIETVDGIMNAYEIATCSPRIKAMGGGVNLDASLQIGAEPGPEDPYSIHRAADGHFPSVRAMMILAATAAGVQPMGTGSSARDIRDVEGTYKSAVLGRQMGYKGSTCIHPAQIEPLNRGFTPTPEEVEYARKVLKAFEEGLKRGTASVSLEGRMVDIPVAERAKKLIERAEAIAKFERKKSAAIEAAGD